MQVCDSVLYVLMCMYESPPELAAIQTLCSFLFWMHPAESHFVHSQVDQFYFVHKWGNYFVLKSLLIARKVFYVSLGTGV